MRRLALPPSKRVRETAIVMRFRRRGDIWSCIGCEYCVSVQKHNRVAGMKLLSFQFNCFHSKYSIPTCFYYHHYLPSLLTYYFFYKNSVNWIVTVLIITTLLAHS